MEKYVSGLFFKFQLQTCNNFEPEALGYGSKFYQVLALLDPKVIPIGAFEENPSKAFHDSR